MSKSKAGTPLRDRLLEFIQEADGSFSATRLAFLLWSLGVLLVWMIDSVMARSLEAVPSDVTAIIGILMTGKVVQKFGEDAPFDPPSTASSSPAKASGTATNELTKMVDQHQSPQ